jgi:hypothetical protein
MKMNPLASKPARSRRWSMCIDSSPPASAISARVESADTLNDEVRASVIAIGRQTLAGFHSDSASMEKT